MGIHLFTGRMMACLQLLLSLATLSQARAAPTPVSDQVPVSDASSSGAVNYGSGSWGHLPGFTPGFHGGSTVYGGQQPVSGGYGGQPVHGGRPGYGQPPTPEGQPGYGSGPMSAPQFCVPYGGFGPFVDGLGGYYGRPYGGFGGQMRKSGRYGGVGMNFGGFGGKYGGFYPFGDYEDMFDDRNDDDFLADLYGVDLEEDEHLTSTRARLEKYLQKQWQLGKRKLQVQVDFGNVPLEWEYLNQYHGVRHPLAMTVFGPKYGLAGPPPPMYDYGYGPVQQGGLPMPSPFFGQQTPGSWQQQQFGPAPVQQPEAPVQGEETVQQPATSP